MRRAILTAAAALLFATTAAAEDISVIRAEGAAMRADDEAAVKKAAIDKALRGAVEAAFRPMASKEAVELPAEAVEANVYSDPRAFILNYRVLTEGWLTHTEPPPLIETTAESGPAVAGYTAYHVWIEASVDSRKLRAAVNRMASRGNDPVSSITVTLLDITDWKVYSSLLDTIRSMPIVKSVSYDSFLRGRVTLYARVAGGREKFYERITREVGDSFMVIPGGPSAVIIKAAPKPVASE